MYIYYIRKYIWIEGYEIDTVKKGAWGLQSEDLEPQPYCSVAMASHCKSESYLPLQSGGDTIHTISLGCGEE